MKIAVTGASGFIGQNLVVALKRMGHEVAGIDVDSPLDALGEAVDGAHVVFHLAGVNRPSQDAEFMRGNLGPLEQLFSALDAVPSSQRVTPPPTLVLSSSTQAVQENPYGRSKLAAEHALERYATAVGTPAIIYRLPGVFGKWCRPNYNSVVATFCHNTARKLPITISDPDRVVELVHVDDVVAHFVQHLDWCDIGVARPTIQPTFSVSLSKLAAIIAEFRAGRQALEVPDTTDPLRRRLFGTYVSYLPVQDLPYSLVQRTDVRGTLAELLKSERFGQMFVSRTWPGVTRGNHYHDLKVEKFCVLDGEAVIRFRPVLGREVTEHRVSGLDFKVVDIPPGVTHSIENVGETELIVLFWASQMFDLHRPDTYGLEVLGG